MDPRDPPIYVSELKEKSMNPDFKFFSLADFRRFSREDAVVIRIWSMSGASGISTLLVEAEVYLPSLIRIGKTVRLYHNVSIQDAYFRSLNPFIIRLVIIQ